MGLRGAALATFLVLAGCGPSSAPKTIARDELVAACARLAACMPSVAPMLNATNCSAWSEAAREEVPISLRDGYRCVNLAVGDCNRIVRCFDSLVRGIPCPAAPSTCRNATVEEACFLGLPVALDCSLDELTCVTPADVTQAVACGVGPCDASYVASCADSEHALQCQSGVAARVRCPGGTSCVNGVCTGTGAGCSGTDVTCSTGGKAVVTCTNGREAHLDCTDGDYVQKCGATVDGGVPTCLGAEDPLECNFGAFVDRCNGVRLEYCQDGRVRGLDCPTLGFKACQPSGDATKPSTCVPYPQPDAGPPDAPPPPPSDAS